MRQFEAETVEIEMSRATFAKGRCNDLLGTTERHRRKVQNEAEKVCKIFNQTSHVSIPRILGSSGCEYSQTFENIFIGVSGCPDGDRECLVSNRFRLILRWSVVCLHPNASSANFGSRSIPIASKFFSGALRLRDPLLPDQNRNFEIRISRPNPFQSDISSFKSCVSKPRPTTETVSGMRERGLQQPLARDSLQMSLQTYPHRRSRKSRKSASNFAHFRLFRSDFAAQSPLLIPGFSQFGTILFISKPKFCLTLIRSMLTAPMTTSTFAAPANPGPVYEAQQPVAYTTYASSPVSTYEVIPHRVFVGGFPASTTEVELRAFFEELSPNTIRVREAKVVRSNDGASKGYGFITFESEEEANAVRSMNPEHLEFKGRRLNLGPARRRMSQSAARYAEPAFFASNGQIVTTNNMFAMSPGFLPHNVVVVPQQQMPWTFSQLSPQAAPFVPNGMHGEQHFMHFN
ncbi:hypothetical protein L596_014093 [Steinernema carpocapsae]|uniref:RRM domain-containing protein n=1 Tax=Steinernema carpocapsae TaxID=34508 RepID=A0A4U5NAI7_STECR|nr:hypothetical protein L596_014093 [Steinernema carpocapsae]